MILKNDLFLLAFLCLAPVAYCELPGHPDPNFKPPVIEGGPVLTIAGPSDGKLLVAGKFGAIDGTPVKNIARLNSDGSLDTTFTPPEFEYGSLRALLLLPDGSCLVGGNFQVGAEPAVRFGLVKLMTNGVLDVGFPDLTGFGGAISTMALEASGRILVGGGFFLNRGRSKANIFRLLANGAVDDSFNPNAANEVERPTVNGPVQKIISLPDGRILITGGFTRVGDIPRAGVARLQSDGAVDKSFEFSAEHDCCIQDIMVQDDGKILIAGSFTNFNGLFIAGIVRLNRDGGLDASFHSLAGPVGIVNHMAAANDRRILLAGAISQATGTGQFGVVRLFSDGELDTTFRTPLAAQTTSELIVRGPAGRLYQVERFVETPTSPVRYGVQKLIQDEPPDMPPQVLTDPADIVAREWDEVVLVIDEVAKPRPAYQWKVNGLEIQGATNRVLKISNIRLPAAGDYQLTIQNSLGTTTSKPIHLVVDPGQTGPGGPDLEYDPGTGVFGSVGSMQELPDGKVLVEGQFSGIQGVGRSHLARLNPDGSVDTSFVPQTSEFVFINSAMPSSNGSIVVMGNNNVVNNARSKIVRLMTDGSVDVGFKPFFSPDGNLFASLYVDPKGFVYLSGNYDNSFSGLFRLLPDGNRDTSYRISMDGLAFQMIGQADGKVLLIGYFSAIAGRDRNHFARLNADGTLDETFVPEAIYNDSVPGLIAVQPDGKIIAVDQFYGYGSSSSVTFQPRTRLSRFNADGSLDLSFFPDWDDRATVTAIKVQSTGGIILAATPFEYVDPPLWSLLRLFPDGSLDYGFDRETKLNGPVAAVASLIGDGLLLAGPFTQIAGSSRNGLARLRAGESIPVAPAIVRQPAGERIPEGADLILDPSIRAAPRASYQWQKDGVDLPGQTNRLLALRNVKTANAGDYRIVAANASGSDTSSIAKVLIDPTGITPGSVDMLFYSSSGPNGAVNQVVELSDGKLLIAGNFTAVDHKLRPRIARLNADGSLDEQFNPPVGPNNEISCLAVLDDGQILIGGPFERIGATNHPYLAALNPDGTLNPTNKIAAQSRVNRIVFAKDGRVLACGDGFVQRWNPNGSQDSTFQAYQFDGIALALDFAPDGKIVVGGTLSGDGGLTRANVARLNANGSVEVSFKPGSGSNDRIDDLVVQPDGKILIAGAFTSFDGVPRGRIARLNIDGSLDSSFDVQTGATGGRIVSIGHFGLRDVTAIHSLFLQADGHIVISGEFSAFENIPAGNIARLYQDGTIDQNFIVGAGFPSAGGRLQNWYNESSTFSSRWVARVQPAGNDAIFAMGNFPGINGAARPRIVKLLGGEVAPSAPVIKSKADAFEARAGTNLLLYVQALGTPRTSFQWFHDGQIILGATSPSLALKNVRRLAAGEYSCLVSNSLGSVQFMAARIGIIPPRIEAGAVDTAFSANWDPTFQINSATFEKDGKILLAGVIPFNTAPPRPVALRLKPDGSTEQVFDFKGVRSQARNIQAVSLPDGNILINGSLELIQANGDVISVNWVRFKPNGALDPTYTPPTNTGNTSFMIKLSNGKILAGGDGGMDMYPRVYRLNADGTLDNSFAPNVTFDAQLIQAAEDEQGRLLIGGDFSMIGSVKRNRIVRLNPDGAVDAGFDPKVGPDGGVAGIALQPDGSIIISGWFGTVAGAQKLHLARLDADGSLDATFPKSDLGLQDAPALVVAPDGGILLAGSFQLPPNQNQSTFQVLRLDSDGSIDPTLNIGSGFEFVSRGGRFAFQPETRLGITPTGKILIRGAFGRVDELPRNGIVRLYSEAGSRLVLQLDPSVQNSPSADDRRWRLLWDEGALEEATNVSGPWRSTETATNPLILLPQDSPKFYRLRVDL